MADPTPLDPLASLAQFKVYASISGSAQDAKINALLAAASDIVRRLCDADFTSVARTEYHSGRDNFLKTYVTLGSRPVESLDTISIRCGHDDYVDSDVTCYDLNPDRGTLHGRFPRGIRNVKVVYTGGYAVVPDSVQQATMMIAKALLDATANDSTLQAEKIGDYSYSKFAGEGGDVVISPAARAMLAPFLPDPF